MPHSLQKLAILLIGLPVNGLAGLLYPPGYTLSLWSYWL
jgi:hypothetical protein